MKLSEKTTVKFLHKVMVIRQINLNDYLIIFNIIKHLGTEDSKSCCESVEASGLEHLRLLLAQRLTREGLNLAWAPILLPLCQQVANMIIPG